MIKKCDFTVVSRRCGVCGGACGFGTVLQTGRLWVQFPMLLLEFFINLIVLTALWPWG